MRTTDDLPPTGEAVSPAPREADKPARLPEAGEDWPLGTHFVEVPTAEQMRRLLGPSERAVRQQRSAVWFADKIHRARARLPLGMHDRFEEFIFADGRIHAEDAAGHRRHLPAHLKVVRLDNASIGAGEVWDVSASHTAWNGVHFREELYVLVRIEHLTVAPGSRIEIQGNVFIFDCGHIELQRTAAATDGCQADGFEIRIRPVRHPAFSQDRSRLGLAGAHGIHGATGPHSRATRVIGTPFGPQLLEFSADRDGADGADGSDGTNGMTGQNGGMLMLADIRIDALSGFKAGTLLVSAQSGPGEPGGNAGRGGDGGAGGNGADGVDGIDGLINGGSGGRGGNGGNGGDGGRGGNGGLASNVFIQVPDALTGWFRLCSMDSVGGPGGAGGEGGAAGSAGVNGILADRDSAPTGTPGRDGIAGPAGKPRPGPKIHLFTDRRAAAEPPLPHPARDG